MFCLYHLLLFVGMAGTLLQTTKGFKPIIGKQTRISSTLSGKKLSAPEGFCPPEPKFATVTDGDYIGFLGGIFAASIRLGSGVFALGWEPISSKPTSWPGTLGVIKDGSSVISKCARPAKTIIIYEYEASPFCRKVREACSMLDLEVEYRPCPGARAGWSDDLSKKTKGKRTVPYLIDPNSKTEMFESDDIIEYLFDTYGPGSKDIPWLLKGSFALQTCIYAAKFRNFAGSRLLPNVRKDIQSVKPVVLWAYEGSPFVRPARETLCSLGLAHKVVNCPRGSENRGKLFEKTGRFQVPYLEDPNTGVNMFEGAEIVKYLKDTYTE